MIHLLKYFKTLSLRPENAKEIRALILELAIRGRLTEEWRRDNPEVEPAGVLLERIRKEKARLMKEKVIRKEKDLAKIDEDELPFKIPSKWEWSYLGAYTHNFGQKKPDQPFTYIDVGSIDNERGIIADFPTNLNPEDAPSRARKIIKAGCVIYSTVRPYLLNIAVVEREFDFEPIASTAFAVLNPAAGCPPKYLYTVLRSATFIQYVESQMKGVAYPAINDKQLMVGLVPVPPLPEQKAIVATVNRLLAEVDELEQQTTRFQALRQDYVTASLRALTGEDSGEAWAELRPHFQSFFNQENGVKKLREAILELAVQGKLTARWRAKNPDVESAGVLLERIGVEKAKLQSNGAIRKSKPAPSVNYEEYPFDLPKSWRLSNMIDLFRFIDYRGKTPKKIDAGVRLITAKNVRPGYLKLAPEEFLSEDEYDDWMTRGFPEKGDLLFTTEAPLGNVCQLLIDETVCLAQRIITLQPYGKVDKRFFMFNMMSNQFQTLITEKATGMTAQGIKASKLKVIPISVPPLPEQKAIVKIVDKLLALCDRLEGQIEERETVGEDFLRASVRELLLATENVPV